MSATVVDFSATVNTGEVVPFTFEPTDATVRTILIDNEPWFVAKDVAETLGYVKPENAIAAHCKAATETRTGDTQGRLSKTIIIPERDFLAHCKALKKLNSSELRELGFTDDPPFHLAEKLGIANPYKGPRTR